MPPSFPAALAHILAVPLCLSLSLSVCMSDAVHTVALPVRYRAAAAAARVDRVAAIVAAAQSAQHASNAASVLDSSVQLHT